MIRSVLNLAAPFWDDWFGGGGDDGGIPGFCPAEYSAEDCGISFPPIFGGGGWGGGGGGGGGSPRPPKPSPPLGGERLGIPASMKFPNPTLLSILIPSLPQCDFGPCVNIGNGFTPAVLGAVPCLANPVCAAIILGVTTVAVVAYVYVHYRPLEMSKGGTQNVVPSWAEGNQPLAGESASEMADRLCKAHYPPDGAGCGTGPTSERNRIRKWAHRKWGI